MLLALQIIVYTFSQSTGSFTKMCIRDRVWDFRKREKVAKNAHVEVFADGTVLLFNYADRDPLTNNAHVTDVTKDVFENLNRD